MGVRYNINKHTGNGFRVGLVSRQIGIDRIQVWDGDSIGCSMDLMAGVDGGVDGDTKCGIGISYITGLSVDDTKETIDKSKFGKKT